MKWHLWLASSCLEKCWLFITSHVKYRSPNLKAYFVICKSAWSQLPPRGLWKTGSTRKVPIWVPGTRAARKHQLSPTSTLVKYPVLHTGMRREPWLTHWYPQIHGLGAVERNRLKFKSVKTGRATIWNSLCTLQTLEWGWSRWTCPSSFWNETHFFTVYFKTLSD